jgi:hypothetical protein
MNAMSNDERETKIENLPARTDDGFDDNDNSDRLLQGTRAACVDGEWTRASDGTEIPPEKRFLCLGTAEGLQHWEDGKLIEEIKKKPNESLPDVDDLNGKIPEDTWEEGINGPRPPWTHVYAVYLLDEDDGSILTHINSTDGEKIATRELKSRVKWKRAMLGGQRVNPIVTLGKQLVSRQYKKMGPAFIIVNDWRDFGSALPEQTAPRQLEDHTEKKALNDPVADIGRPVVEPTLEEMLNDKIPEDDWRGPGEPAAEEAPKTPETPRKPAAQKPQMTKRGVQKIAGGRR